MEAAEQNNALTPPPDAQQRQQRAPEGGAEQQAPAPRKTPALIASEQVGEVARSKNYKDGAAAMSPASGDRVARPVSIPVPNYLTSAFDQDLSEVQLHYGTGLPDDAGVMAFTEDEDIFVADNAPDLETPEGKRLIGHELAHVVQQKQGAAGDDGGGGGGANSDHEGEAEAAGEAAASGQQASVSGASTPGTRQNRGKTGPSPQAIENAKNRNADVNGNAGNFNVKGSATGKSYEFVNRGGKYYVRAKPQVTKDRNTVSAQGEDPDSTKNTAKHKVSAEANLNIAKVEESASLLETKEGGETLLEGGAGKLTGEGHVGKASAGAEAGATINKDGVEVKVGANVGVSLAGGKLTWTLPTTKFDILGETLEAIFGAELSADVAANAKGEVGLKVGKGDKGVKVGASAGGEAFAGAKAGFKLFGKGMWHTKEGPQDTLGAFAGVEGWAGAAAAAKFTANLVPSVKFEGYLGAAVGIGASAKVGVEAQVVNIARLGYILAKRGLPLAWEGLQQYAGQVGEWLVNGAAELYDIGTAFVDSVSTNLLGDTNTIKLIDRGGHKHMNFKDRAKLIDRLISGTCFNEEENAVLEVLRFSKKKGDHWLVCHWVDGGLSEIQWALDGAQDTELNQIMS